MKSQEDKKVKYNTYIPNDVVQALKNLAHKKRVSACYVIESAIRKCIPEKYFHDSED